MPEIVNSGLEYAAELLTLLEAGKFQKYFRIELIDNPVPFIHAHILAIPEMPKQSVMSGKDRKLTSVTFLPEEPIDGRYPSRYEELKYREWRIFSNELSVICEVLLQANLRGLIQLPKTGEDSRVHALFSFNEGVKQRLIKDLNFVFTDVLTMPQYGLIDGLLKHILKQYVLNDLVLPNMQTGQEQLLTESIPTEEGPSTYTATRILEKENLSPAEIAEIRENYSVSFENEEIISFRVVIESPKLTDKQKVLKVIESSPVAELLKYVNIEPVLHYLPIIAVTAFFFELEKKVSPAIYGGNTEKAHQALQKRVETTLASY